MFERWGTEERTVFSRRTVLRATAITGLTAATFGYSAQPTRATSTVSGGGDALQTAIDNANDGETIVVTDTTTYDPIVVDVAVTILADTDGDEDDDDEEADEVYETTDDEENEGEGEDEDEESDDEDEDEDEESDDEDEDETDTTDRRPVIEGNGGISTAVSIESDGVTIEGFTIRNPDGLLGVKVEREYDGTTIKDNVVEDIGPTGRLGVTGIIVGQGDHDDIEITNNTIRRLDQETTEDSGFPTVNGILFDADNDDPGTISAVTVDDNTIRTIESDIAPLGIVVQHRTDDVTITDNEISGLVAADGTDSDQSDDVDFDFTFAQGINIAAPSTNATTITRNVIRDITSAETILPEAVKIDGDGGGVTVRANQLLVAIGLNNRNGTKGPADAPTVDARNNWWGSSAGPEEADFNQDADDDDRRDVIGNVTYEPFLEEPPEADEDDDDDDEKSDD